MRKAWWLALLWFVYCPAVASAALPRGFESTPSERLHSLLGLVALTVLCCGVGRLRGARLGGWVGVPSLTIDTLLSYPFRPLVWLIGVPGRNAPWPVACWGLRPR
jgi:hypothetical protein